MKIKNANDSKLFQNLIHTCNESIRSIITLSMDGNSVSDLVFINFMISKFYLVMRQRWKLSLEGRFKNLMDRYTS